MKFIPVAQPSIGKEEEVLIRKCIRSTWISSTGKYLQIFEQSFAKYFNVPYAISCSNGTAALHLALLALGIGTGDEVILPVLTFVSCANVIRYVGATPVFVDIDPDTWNIDANKIIKKINSKTRAIMPVHLYGYPANMRNILKIANEYSLYVIEDAAEAHAAKIKNNYVGTFGDIGCFSFFGNKIITTGEGGMIITHKKKLRDKILLLKNHGMSLKKRYFHPIIGYNYRMTNMQAALGFVQLKKIKKLLIKRDWIEKTYRNNLKNIDGLKFQPIKMNTRHVCWLFAMLMSSKLGKRNLLINFLNNYGIDSRPFFIPLTAFPMYKTDEKFPVATGISEQGINLPTSFNLTRKQIIYITQIVKKFIN